MEEHKPNILEYAIVIIMVIVTTIATLFGKKFNKGNEDA